MSSNLTKEACANKNVNVGKLKAQKTWTGSASTKKLNSSPHIGFLEPGTMELHEHE